jgi:hypothetical protein
MTTNPELEALKQQAVDALGTAQLVELTIDAAAALGVSPEELPELLTRPQAAKVLKTTIHNVRYHRDEGHLLAMKNGVNRTRIPIYSVLMFKAGIDQYEFIVPKQRKATTQQAVS